ITDPSTWGQTLEIGGPEDLTLNEVAAAIQRAAGRAGAPRHVPRGLLHVMAAAMRPVRPDFARPAPAALVLDEGDMTFYAPALPAPALAEQLNPWDGVVPEARV